ncbi:MAG: hypothetical protein IT478_08120 [Xanthomonadales bacterium]|nr:hypothetical protein [Xanthomonadales bacterium]
MKSLFAALLGSLVLSTTATAHVHSLVDLQVVDRDTGAVLDVHHRRGQAYVAGEPGHRYAVLMQNRIGERVMAVLSVDGVNAVTGETANPYQGGYVLGPYERAEINGWRKSMSEVAQFVFSAPEASYAARTGRPQNVGVIGIAVFRERVPVYAPPPPPVYRDDEWRRKSMAPGAANEADAMAQRAAPAPSAEAGLGASRDQPMADAKRGRSEEFASELGTAHGRREWSEVNSTQFERRSSRPDEVVQVQYDTFEHLVERGVIRRPRWHHDEPRAFAGFVPDP